MKISKTLTVFAFALSAALAGTSAQAERVKWKMHSAWGSQVPHLGTEAVRFADDIVALSGGDFKVKFFEPGALLSTYEDFNATSNGSVEMAWSTAAYDVAKFPALAYFSAVPFGPSFSEYMAWIWHHGGADIRDRIYDQNNIKAMHCLAVGPESSGWFREEISELDQLRGMKMAFSGLGARVMQRLGVSTQLLAGGDIFPALEVGVIDAAQFSMPETDIKYGFYQLAKNNYFPAWHQRITIGTLKINKDKWNSLSDQNKAIIETACRSSLARSYVESDANSPSMLARMGEERGVITRRWRDDQLAVFEQAWTDVVNEDSAKDPQFKEVSDSYMQWRKKYSKWADAQNLKPTYLN
ncbi:TRAP-type mannitol/chloroaromatic compound transport system substrate-binding protein [Sinobacterium caligoides]|uniref:TRAP-type mannitol/chloroaromatic compound transport system substrate-binding protein n=1 Tax=Sinobacterium caligoides TaxID=933926 RepID=A0A3N2DDP8_9GAMM|nr:TRAP transporter substrate-binding protein [Sinobacterium caligoides]ROR97909.1 TRAP-type mannitol/chloroaromatic compound transport system substrate-binding protein [Sinobacterium caligoides]